MRKKTRNLIDDHKKAAERAERLLTLERDDCFALRKQVRTLAQAVLRLTPPNSVFVPNTDPEVYPQQLSIIDHHRHINAGEEIVEGKLVTVSRRDVP